jgi:class 3 adenylate cyclase
MSQLWYGVAAVGRKHVRDFPGLTFRFLIAIDVEGFSQRHMAEQRRVQDDLEQAMSQAAAGTGLDRERWYRQPGGDGELAVLPEDADGLALVADYPRKLASSIARVNDPRKGGRRLRVRMCIHHGAVLPGPFGPVGAPIAISRLIDADPVRELPSHCHKSEGNPLRRLPL